MSSSPPHLPISVALAAHCEPLFTTPSVTAVPLSMAVPPWTASTPPFAAVFRDRVTCRRELRRGTSVRGPSPLSTCNPHRRQPPSSADHRCHGFPSSVRRRRGQRLHRVSLSSPLHAASSRTSHHRGKPLQRRASHLLHRQRGWLLHSCCVMAASLPLPLFPLFPQYETLTLIAP
ncbi:hypothetical protein SESBI_14799 [Sesbania bispinosa]|nr:hypothetical protein SESBI_14799 [Sesbania bispinosa]